MLEINTLVERIEDRIDSTIDIKYPKLHKEINLARLGKLSSIEVFKKVKDLAIKLKVRHVNLIPQTLQRSKV